MRFIILIALMVGVATANTISATASASASVTSSTFGTFGIPQALSATAQASSSVSTTGLAAANTAANAAATISASASARATASTSASSTITAPAQTNRRVFQFRSQADVDAFIRANPNCRLVRLPPSSIRDPCTELITELEPCAPPPCIYRPPTPCIIRPQTKTVSVKASAKSSVKIEQPAVTLDDCIPGEEPVIPDPIITTSSSGEAKVEVDGEVVDQDSFNNNPTTYTGDGDVSTGGTATANYTGDAPDAQATSLR